MTHLIMNLFAGIVAAIVLLGLAGSAFAVSVLAPFGGIIGILILVGVFAFIGLGMKDENPGIWMLCGFIIGFVGLAVLGAFGLSIVALFTDIIFIIIGVAIIAALLQDGELLKDLAGNN